MHQKQFFIALQLFVLLLSSLPPALCADTLSLGAEMPSLTLEDQHGSRHTIVNQAGIVIFAPDRESAKIAHQLLQRTDQEALDRSGIHYVSDISGMPSIITRMLALPKLREYAYRVLLGYDQRETAMLPRRSGHLSVLRLRDGRMDRVDFTTSVAELSRLTGLAAN